jgi:flotillin
MGLIIGIIVAVGVVFLAAFFWCLSRRRIVPTNMVHVVQKARTTKSYGAGLQYGNVYYQWPEWFPIVGVKVRELSVSNFDLSFQNYEAYDAARLPFNLDIQCFFRISDTNAAAAKVESMTELYKHLQGIVQGAVRSLLAKSELEEIMTERSKFGKDFTAMIGEQLKEWGVVSVKNIELMDIRDTKDSNVIYNIMAKKKSEIEKESRTTVARNKQLAESAEIEAGKEILVKRADADMLVGERQAEQAKKVGIAKEQSQQEIEEEARKTAEKRMAVQQVNAVRQADIDKQAAIIRAEAAKKTAELNAEAQKAVTVNNADARQLAAERDAAAVKMQKAAEAKGIEDVGNAKAKADKELQLATVAAQIELANKIGKDKEYQQYLIKVKQIEIEGEVRKAQADALRQGDLKVMVNSGDVAGGVNKISDIFTPKGGASIAGALEAINQTENGGRLLDKILAPKKPKAPKNTGGQ